MSRYLVIFSVLIAPLFVLAAPPVERKLYVGKDSTEAIMKYHFEVHFAADKAPTEEEAEEKIEAQITHLFGPMGEAAVKAVPTGDHEITKVTIKKGREAGSYVASYDFEGKIVLQNGPKDKYSVVLPYSPDTIYEESAVGRGTRKSYPCTDHHYNSEGDFWYFWNPKNPGCKLKKGENYDVVETSVKRLPNTKVTYPEYHRLAQSGTIRIDVLFGMDDPEKARDPLKSTDENAKNFRQVRQSLEKMGFEARKWDAKEIAEIYPKRDAKPPYVEEFEKKDKKAKLVVRLFFGPTGIDEESTAFHYFFKDALEHASVMVYDGHSGLGGHLDLDSIEKQNKFKFNITGENYQIYFFNSCSSYTYYNKMYFKRKQTQADPKGTKQLDILTNGLATYFYVMHDTNLAMVKAIDAWAEEKGVASYQALAKNIDSGNLFGVNGDEDNPTRPGDVE